MHVAGAKNSAKIVPLEELSKILSQSDGKRGKVALCHGVFDLLHVGHIRYFEQAKKLANTLVVTITSDRYVNKGPHRPAFSQNLRAEAVAALECVDYVAISDWPRATEVIKSIKPDFYVKGPDFKDAEKDLTGGITIEQEAIESVGGQIVFTDDITFSSSNLLNKHMPAFPEEVSNYLAEFATRFSKDDIIGYLTKARKLKALVIGEAIIDDYQYCEAIGKSSKEPMLAVKRLQRETFAGGTLAVANHIANFVDSPTLLTALGAIDSQEDFIRSQLNDKINAQFLYRNNSPTIIKQRFIERYFFTKLFEVYSINDELMDTADEDAFCDKLLELVPLFDLVIVVDFGHGLMTKNAVEIVSSKSRFLAVNTQCNAGNLGYQTIAKYEKANFVTLTEAELRMESRDRRGKLEPLIEKLAQKHGFSTVVVTQGAAGCTCYSAKEGIVSVPPFAGKIVDRMGAGDAFLSITSLLSIQDVPLEVIGFVGNVVGAQAVATVGHRSAVDYAGLCKGITALLL